MLVWVRVWGEVNVKFECTKDKQKKKNKKKEADIQLMISHFLGQLVPKTYWQ